MTWVNSRSFMGLVVLNKLKFLSLILIILTSLGRMAEAETSDVQCIWDMRAPVPLNARDLKFTEVPTAASSSLHLELVGRVRGRRGGRSYVLRRTGSSWASSYQVKPNFPIGDPRALALIFGPTGAEFFGYRKFDDKHIVLPDLIELNAALDELDRRLQVRETRVGQVRAPTIDLRFAPVVGVQSDEEFLKQFAMEYTLPMSGRGMMVLSDLSYRVAVITMPKKYLRYAQEVTRRILHFASYLKTRTDSHGSAEYIDYWQVSKELIKKRSADLHVGLGNYTVVLYDLILDRLDDAISTLDDSLSYLIYAKQPFSVDNGFKNFMQSYFESRIRRDSNFTEERKKVLEGIAEDFLKLFGNEANTKEERIDTDFVVMTEVEHRFKQIRDALAQPE